MVLSYKTLLTKFKIMMVTGIIKDQDIMFFRTNQQDLSRLTDVQLLVSQKLRQTSV